MVEKKYRVNVNIGTSASWTSVERTFIPPPNYKVDFIQIKLYGYFPGECYFDNIVVRPLSPTEAKEWLAKQKPRKDKRFR